MERIIQITEKEYNELYNMAKLNEEEIDAKVIERWNEKGAAYIEIQTYLDGMHEEDFKIKCRSRLCDQVKDSRMEINDDVKKSIEGYINSNVMKLLEDKYGNGVDFMNTAIEKEAFIDRYIKSAIFFTFSGWGAFIGCLMYLIFG